MPVWAVSYQQEASLALLSPWLQAMEVRHIRVKTSSSSSNSLLATLSLSSFSNSELQATSSPKDMVPNSLPTGSLPRLVSRASPRAWGTCKWEEPSLPLSSSSNSNNSLKAVLVL